MQVRWFWFYLKHLDMIMTFSYVPLQIITYFWSNGVYAGNIFEIVQNIKFPTLANNKYHDLITENTLNLANVNDKLYMKNVQQFFCQMMYNDVFL